MRPLLIGLAASLFFSSTYLLNRLMQTDGGSWLWSAALRYFWMTPLLFALVALRGNLKPLWAEMARAPGRWLLWSTIGFGLFYAPLCFAAASGPAWLVAGTFQLTIVAGVLAGPWLEGQGRQAFQRLPWLSLAFSGVILAGVALMQMQAARHVTAAQVLLGVVPVAIAALAYPVGNRQMMRLCEGRLDAFQRTLGMTLASLPVWIGLALWGGLSVGAPSASQLTNSFGVALFSGVCATLLFFTATDQVKHSPAGLAAVEATQATELLFTVLGEVLWLGRPWPSGGAVVGMAGVVLGMIGQAFASTPSSLLPGGGEGGRRPDEGEKKPHPQPSNI